MMIDPATKKDIGSLWKIPKKIRMCMPIAVPTYVADSGNPDLETEEQLKFKITLRFCPKMDSKTG